MVRLSFFIGKKAAEFLAVDAGKKAMAKATVGTTAALLRRSSGLSPCPPYTFFPKPHILSFSTYPHSENLCIRTPALRPVTPPSGGSDVGDDDPGFKTNRDSFKMSRNELKRDARRAVRWGMDLSTFSLPQIKSILRYRCSIDCASSTFMNFLGFFVSWISGRLLLSGRCWMPFCW